MHITGILSHILLTIYLCKKEHITGILSNFLYVPIVSSENDYENNYENNYADFLGSSLQTNSN